jgi:hypothetical protein
MGSWQWEMGRVLGRWVPFGEVYLVAYYYSIYNLYKNYYSL